MVDPTIIAGIALVAAAFGYFQAGASLLLSLMTFFVFLTFFFYLILYFFFLFNSFSSRFSSYLFYWCRYRWCCPRAWRCHRVVLLWLWGLLLHPC